MSTFLGGLWRHWSRGFRNMAIILQISYLPLIVPFWFGPIFGTSFPWNAPLWFVLTYTLFAVPLLLSWTTVSLDGDSHRRESKWFETTMLQLGEKAGVDWQGHLATRIDALLADGHRSEAVRLYRQEKEVTWDDAYTALENWSEVHPFGPIAPTRLQLRVTTLREQMEKSEATSTAAVIC